MENIINKRFCLVYDTFKEMIEDPDITPGTIVMTLGYNEIYDEGYNIYKIVTKDFLSNGTLIGRMSGRKFGFKSPYYALNISSNFGNELNSKIIENTACIKGVDTSMNLLQQINDTPKEAKDMSSPNSIMREYCLDEYGDVKVVQINNGSRYIITTDNCHSIYNITVQIDDGNRWIIPAEFELTNYKIDTLSIGTNNHIDYIGRDTLLFTLKLSPNTSNLIPY